MEININNLTDELQLNRFLNFMSNIGCDKEDLTVIELLFNSFRKQGIPTRIIINAFTDFINQYKGGAENE